MTMHAVLKLTLVCLVVGVAANRQRWGRIEKDYTFRSFNLKSPSSEFFPFWRLGGAASIDGEIVKFQSANLKKPGYVWNQKPVTMTAWEAILEFGVKGPAPINTGEGLAFWVVSDPGTDGAVYGHSDMFNGLGIFFDSFDSDGDGVGEPYVLAMSNDGAKPIDAEGAGKQLGVCFADYRNLPHAARAKISFSPDNGGHLTVGLDLTNSGKFKSCLSVKDVKLRPDIEYFGLSTSDYGNNFDVISFLGINTSSRFEPATDDKPSGSKTSDAMLPEDSESDDDSNGAAAVGSHHSHGVSEHAHFEIMFSTLAELDQRMLLIEDEFGKHFASVFHHNNKNLQHHIASVLQSDVDSKHEDVTDRVVNLSAALTKLQQAIGTVRLQLEGTGEAKPDALADLIPQIKGSCVEDANRGQALVSKLKESVAELRTRQEQILTNVHKDLLEVKTGVSNACAGTTSVTELVGFGVVGVVVGAVISLLTKSAGHEKGY